MNLLQEPFDSYFIIYTWHNRKKYFKLTPENTARLINKFILYVPLPALGIN